MRGVSRDPLPNLDDDEASIGSLGTIESHNTHSSSKNVTTFGMDQRKVDKFVFRAGFKVRKQIYAQLHCNRRLGKF